MKGYLITIGFVGDWTDAYTEFQNIIRATNKELQVVKLEKVDFDFPTKVTEYFKR